MCIRDSPTLSVPCSRCPAVHCVRCSLCPGCSLRLGCSRPVRRGMHANMQPNERRVRCSLCPVVSGAALVFW
eukprot:830517-Alexandrium_andersonii.AAC.1